MSDPNLEYVYAVIDKLESEAKTKNEYLKTHLMPFVKPTDDALDALQKDIRRAFPDCIGFDFINADQIVRVHYPDGTMKVMPVQEVPRAPQ